MAWRPRLALLAPLAISLLASACGEAEPSPEPERDGGKIAFLRTGDPDEDPTTDLVVSNPDGTGQITLLDDPTGLWGPTWSPDGKRIAVMRARPLPSDYEQATRWSLVVVAADGTGAKTIATFRTWLPEPSWSPDGTRLVVPRADQRGLQLWVMHADGSRARPITRFPDAYVSSPSWSPDGRRIAFTYGPINGLDERLAVYIVTVEGGRIRKVTNVPGAGWPDWSPDGTTLVFQTLTGIFSIRPDGTGLSRVLTEEAPGDSGPAWSPDGTKIVFGTDRWAAPPPAPSTTSAELGSIGVVASNGRCPTEIPNTRGGFSPDWHGDPEAEATVRLRC